MTERVRRRGSLVACAVLALALVAGPATAADDGAEALGLEVSAGHGGQVAGEWMPVSVALSPRRPVVATLEVSARGAEGQQIQQRDVELRAGANAVYRFVLPSGPTQITVREPGHEPVTARAPSPAASADDVVIGLLDRSAQPPPVLDPVTERTGTWATVDRRWLASGAPALASLSGLVVDAAVLSELDDRAVRTLRTATVGGMDLVIVATAPGQVDLRGIAGDAAVTVSERADRADLRSVAATAPAWPVAADDVWRDGDPATTVALTMASGRGRVNVVTVAPGSGDVAGAPRLWRLLTLGRPPPSSTGGTTMQDASATGARLTAVFADASEMDPPLPWLATFLVAYIVVAGPVSGALLARHRRRELTWITVPAVAIVFTLAAVIGVPGARPLREERGALRWWLDGAGEHLVLASVRAPTESVRDVRLPGSDWTVRTIAGGADGASIRASEGDMIVGLSLPSLALGGVIASRPAATPPPLHVDATVDGAVVVVTVRNDGAEPVTDVVVRAGAARRPAGRLDPGETAQAVFTDDALPDVAPYAPLHDPHVATADSLLDSGVGAPEPGVVWATGSAGGTTLMVGGRPVGAGGALLTPPAVDRALMTSVTAHTGPLMIEGAQGVVRLRVPAAMAPDRLADRLGDATLEVWDATAEAWVPREDAFDGGVGDTGRLLSPTGELYLRNTRRDQFTYARSSLADTAVRSGAADQAGQDAR